jgi:ribonucleoside-triphosphate reductase
LEQNFNPCYEISFLPVSQNGACGAQFCNLTSINGSKITTREDFLEAVKAATIIGTLQAGYTNFKYLNQTAKELTEEEALLGVSITGIMDNPKK